MKKTLLIVDGNGLLYRAYHAFPKGLTSPNGEEMGAVYGFARILLSALKTLKPTHLAVSFDISKPTFRLEKLPTYKGTREKMPDDLRGQIARVHEIVEKLEAPVYAAMDYEADDCIGTIALQAAQHDVDVIILSGDQDLLQLVTDRVAMYAPASAPKKPTLYTPAAVFEKYGFEPKRMVDYKGLRGDPSDNIPGVQGVGEVTATQLLQKFGTLDGIYEAIHSGATDGIKPGILAKLTEQEAQARLSYDIATIRCDAPVTLDLAKCEIDLQHPEHLVGLFTELGFKSLIAELPNVQRVAAAAHDVFGDGAAEESPAPPVHQSRSSDIDTQLEPVLRTMEELGVMIDIPYFTALEAEFAAEIAAAVKSLYDLAGEEFSPDSPQQVAHIFYEKLGIPTDRVRKGKTGYTTDAATMQDLSPQFPIAAALLAYREVTKLQSTYVKPLPPMADANHRIHTSYAPDTATGRISSRNPNLQNIPVKTEKGRRIRRGFVPQPGYCFVAADYSQMELRVAAHLSGDENLIEAFKNGDDFHTETAARMGVDRRTAKVINFSILYGKGAFGFSNDLGISIAEAKAYIEQYFRTFPKLRAFLDKTLEDTRRQGYAETLYGRRRMLPDILSSNFHLRAAAEREAVNLPIQGTQADILKEAMVNLAKRLDGTDMKLILTVHDELVLEAPQEKAVEAGTILEDVMVNVIKLKVPIKVEVKSGLTWADVEPLKLA
jgi:5'-3' exonuclease